MKEENITERPKRPKRSNDRMHTPSQFTLTSDLQQYNFILLLTIAGCLLLFTLFVIICVPRCVKANKYKVFTSELESSVQTQPSTPTFPLLPPSTEATSSTSAVLELSSDNSSANGGTNQWHSNQLLLDPVAAMLEPAARFLTPRIRLLAPQAAPPSGVILAPDPLRMDRKHLYFLSELAHACFGPVVQADCTRYGESLRERVIVRLLTSGDCRGRNRRHFLADLQAYRECSGDPCVLRLLAICPEEPFLAVMEACATDLKSLLLSERQSGLTGAGGQLELKLPTASSLVVQFASQASRGLAALHDRGFAYQDVGARNCQVAATGSLVVKLGDYGCTQLLHPSDYADMNGDLVPLRWLAPETIRVREAAVTAEDQTVQANVWSLGVLLLELCSLAELPHRQLSDAQLLAELAAGRIHELSNRLLHEAAESFADCCSDGCVGCIDGNSIQDLARLCLRQSPECRPSARQVSELADRRLLAGRLSESKRRRRSLPACAKLRLLDSVD